MKLVFAIRALKVCTNLRLGLYFMKPNGDFFSSKKATSISVDFGINLLILMILFAFFVTYTIGSQLPTLLAPLANLSTACNL